MDLCKIGSLLQLLISLPKGKMVVIGDWNARDHDDATQWYKMKKVFFGLAESMDSSLPINASSRKKTSNSMELQE